MAWEQAQVAKLHFPHFHRLLLHGHGFQDVTFHGVVGSDAAEEAFLRWLLTFGWGIPELI